MMLLRDIQIQTKSLKELANWTSLSLNIINLIIKFYLIIKSPNCNNYKIVNAIKPGRCKTNHVYNHLRVLFLTDLCIRFYRRDRYELDDTKSFNS